MEYDGYERKRCPVKEGQVLDLSIQAIGEKGDGIAKVDGYVIIVAQPVEKDLVYKVRITRTLRYVGFAEVVGEDEPKMIDEREEENETHNN